MEMIEGDREMARAIRGMMDSLDSCYSCPLCRPVSLAASCHEAIV